MNLTRLSPRVFNGVPLRSVRHSRNFKAAATSRLEAGWSTSNIANDSLLQFSLAAMRARSRNLMRNDDYARGFMHCSQRNVIGPNGIGFKSDVSDPGGKPDLLANDAIEAAWKKYSRKENFTVSGMIYRQEAEALIWKYIVRDGEAIYRKVRGFDNPFGFSIQLIEPDYIDENKNEYLSNGDFIRMGVEFSGTYRQPIAYHLRTVHPGDFSFLQPKGSKTIRVPASEITHVFLSDYIEQSRGYPWLHTAMNRLNMLGGYEEAALVAARVAASKMAFLKPIPDANGNYVGDDIDDDGNPISEAEAGVIEQLPNGFDIQSLDWTHPHTEHAAFIKAILRGVAAGAGCSYTGLSNDLEGVNYSSIRAGLLDERDMWMALQNWFIAKVETDIFESWLDMALLSGAITMPNGSALQAAKAENFNAPLFNGRRWAWVDPMKDVQAAVIAVENGFKSPQQIVAEMGGDREDVMRLVQKDKELQTFYGVSFVHEKPTETPDKQGKEEEIEVPEK